MNKYQKLEPGDVIAEGDEVRFSFAGNRWARSQDVGRTIRRIGDLEYRRPIIDPDEGYRLLSAHETICATDEVSISGEWVASVNAGLTPADSYFGNQYRRKVEPEINPGPEPEYGWRLLKPGEVVAKGDRCSFGTYWKETGASRIPVPGRDCEVDGGLVVKHGRYERRIEPGAGYRLLEIGEIIIEGDDIYLTAIKDGWRETLLQGQKVVDAVYRRKVKSEVDPGAGYWLLERGELIIGGDDIYYYADGTWNKTPIAGHRVDGAVVRRKVAVVDPGEGYRLLERGEIIEPSDEWRLRTSPDVWDQVGNHGIFAHDIILPVRRKVAAPPKWPGVRGNGGREFKMSKNYRLLKAGEIIKPADEIYNLLVFKWQSAAEHRHLSVVTDCCCPVRREIDSYTGGPA